jgi:hypothetical protein
LDEAIGHERRSPAQLRINLKLIYFNVN